MKYLALVVSICCLSLLSCQHNSNDSKPASTAASDTSRLKDLPAQEQHISSLAFNYKAGQVFHYKLDQDQKLVQDDSLSVESSTTAYYTKSIKSVRDGITTFIMKYDSVKSTQSTKGMGAGNKDSKYNSSDSADKANKDYVMMTSLIGEEISVSIDAKGRVTEVGGMSALVNHIATEAQKPLNDQQKAQIAEQLKEIYYAQVVQQEQLSMPDSALDASMIWKRSGQQSIPPAFNSSMTMVYRVAKVSSLDSRKVAIVDGQLSGKIELDPRAKSQVSLKTGTVSGNGTMIVDSESGYTVKKHTVMKQELEASAINPQTKKSETFKQVQTSTLNVQLLK